MAVPTISIIGGGIGGLTLALSLEKAGIEYHLYERVTQLEEVGAGIWLAPNALQVMESLGTLKVISSQGHSIDRITIGTSDLSPISDHDQDFIKQEFGYSSVAIHRARFQQILYERIPSDKISLGSSLDSYSYDPDGNLSIRFENGHEVNSSHVIAADGINSRVRNQLFPNSELRYSGQTCWRGISNINLKSEFQNRGMELWGGRLRFGLSQISDREVYWFAVALAPANQSDPVGTTKQRLIDMYKSYHPMISDIIEATPDGKIMRNDISDLKPIEKWYYKRICLMGDAAHATTPNMGQGGGQAIEDAYYLTKAIQEYGLDTAFGHFQNTRQKKVNKIVTQSWRIGQVAHWKYGQSLRNILMSNIPDRLFKQQMLQLYRLDSSL